MKPQLSKITTNFSRGLNTNSAHLIDPNEVQESENFLFDEGSPYVREGIKVYGSCPAPILGLKRYYKKTGSSYFVAFSDKKLYSAAQSGTLTNISSEELTSGFVHCDFFNDYLYFTNYSNVVMTFDGSNIAHVGLSSPVYRQQIADFETDESWTTGTVDTQYTHRDKGDQALELTTSGTADGIIITDLSTTLGLHEFGTGVSSTDNDLIQIYTVHRKKSDISGFRLIFDCNDGDFSDISADCYRININNLSSWVSCSNDNWSITHVMPKKLFNYPGEENGAGTQEYTWSTVIGIRIELAEGDNPCICTVDNLRMIRTPPIPVGASSIYRDPGDPQEPWSYQEWMQRYNYDKTARKFKDIGILREAYSEYLQGHQLEGGTTGGLSGGIYPYYYKTTFLKEGPNGLEIESNPSYQSSGLAVSSNLSCHVAIDITDITIPPPGQDIIGTKLYRRKSIDNDFSLVYTILDTTGDKFLDDISDDLLGEILEEDHWPPPRSQYIFKANNQRIYYANIMENNSLFPSRVRWSKEYEPYYVPLENGTDVAPDDATEITGIFDNMNLIHVIKERSLWLLDENNIPRNVHPSIGCVAPESIAIGEREAFWLGDGGIYKYTFMNPEDISYPRIKEIIDRLPDDYIKNAVGVYYNGFYLLSVTDQGSTTNNLVLVYDTKSDSWTTFPIAVTSWAVTTGGKDGYRLFYGNYSGLICELFTGNYDISSAIESVIRSKEFGIASPQQAFRKGFLYTESLDGFDKTLTLQPYLDFQPTAETETMFITSGHQISGFSYPQEPGASFGSLKITGSGRYKIGQLDLYGKEESLR